MSQENVDVVRHPITASPRSHRHLDEQLYLRFPGLLSLLSRSMFRLSPRSRLRRAWLTYGWGVIVAALNRGDYESGFCLYHPEGETIYAPGFAQLGFVGAKTRGRAERQLAQKRWHAEWGTFGNDPQEIIDLGDRLLLLGRMKGSGLSSGAGFDNEVGYLMTMSGGQAIRERIFLDHREALEAAGLSE